MKRLGLAVLLVGLASSGCGTYATVKAGSPGQMIAMSSIPRDVKVISHFSIRVRKWKFLFDSGYQPDLTKMISDEVDKAKGDGASNVVVKLDRGCIGGCMVPSLIFTVEGDVFQFQ